MDTRKVGLLFWSSPASEEDITRVQGEVGPIIPYDDNTVTSKTAPSLEKMLTSTSQSLDVRTVGCHEKYITW